MFEKSAVLWTGGKDSCLALCEAGKAGYSIDSLITFAPENPAFLAHPIGFMQMQSEALALPHRIILIKKPYAESYSQAFTLLKEKYQINTVFTGDIDEVDGHFNWVRQYSNDAKIYVKTPLWKMERLEIMERLLEYKFRIIFSCVKKSIFPDAWVGKEIAKDTLDQLKEMNKLKGIDICGEQGEYHTMVLDAPFFRKSIHVDSFSKQEKDDVIYMNMGRISLRDKS